MSLVLSHISAIDYHRANSALIHCAVPRIAQQKEIANVLSQKPSWQEAQDALNLYPDTLSAPLHLLVASKEIRNRSPLALCHIAPTDLPINAISRIRSNLYVCRPSISLIQHASSAPNIELACIASEFAGNYRLDFHSHSFNKAPSIIDLSVLKRITQTHTSLHGSGALHRVLNYVPTNSSSPMETALALLLAFPVKWGGYGFETPQLNRKIDLPLKAQLATGRHYYLADLLWEKEKLIVEYDSDAFHTGHDKIASDARRRNALADLGYKVITVTSDQLLNEIRFEHLAQQVGKVLHKRIRIPSAHTLDQRQKMRAFLFSRRN